MPATGQPTLVGIDDMTFPKWAGIDRRVAEAGLWQTFRALPAGVRVVLRLAWQTSARLTLLTGLLAVASGCATAFGLLATEPAVSDIDLEIHKGQIIALVGENGSGKSTLAKLITGLYRPTGGQVCWDGHELTVLDEQSVQDKIAMVMQEPARWPMTAEDNIRIGRIHRDDPDALAAAARESGADRVIGELPLGGKTVLSRRFASGRDLSGGQWQRISVARGLYRDAPILVADEPTAAMDARAEDAVFRSLQKLSRTNESTRTTILITHRLANIRYADQIVVLDRGKIVELGTHTELMANPATYAQLYELQAAAYAREPGVMVDSGQ